MYYLFKKLIITLGWILFQQYQFQEKIKDKTYRYYLIEYKTISTSNFDRLDKSKMTCLSSRALLASSIKALMLVTLLGWRFCDKARFLERLSDDLRFLGWYSDWARFDTRLPILSWPPPSCQSRRDRLLEEKNKKSVGFEWIFNLDFCLHFWYVDENQI